MSTIGGLIGEIFAALSFSGALVAALSFFFAGRKDDENKKSWERMGSIAFLAHVAGILGVVSTLFYLIYTHQYQYYYVFDHSSNELPVYYMISCFWEGQEGSFLLWTFWHGVLGLILLRSKSEWRNLVMAVVASVNLILASMILGVDVPLSVVQGLLISGLAGMLTWFVFKQWKQQGSPLSLFTVAISALALVAVYVIVSDKGGFFHFFPSGEILQNENAVAWLTAILFWWVCAILFVIHLSQSKTSGMDSLVGFGLLAIALLVMMFPLDDWKIGSTPFMLLRDAIPDAPVFAENPDFIPLNGNGLNSLLQNYWMVIHPPTLFLGFASTTIPFAYVIAGLLRRKYTEWMRPAMPWLLFSGLVLGTGIIMGGYWAYETLNFGGYWNWDAVENSSLVPWLGVLAAIHAILLFRKSGLFLKVSILGSVSAFLLVLYSTFLTRSGILGNTSVHTFTDLGLSGQLLLLLFFYLFAGVLLTANRWREIPVAATAEVPLFSSEVFLFVGICTLIITGVGITLVTSVPVFNAVFGSEMAPPNNVTLFYYEENVWFGILLAILSGLAQFFYWNKKGDKGIGASLLRPFMLAVFSASAIIVLLAVSGREFAFESEFDSWVAQLSGEGFLYRKFIRTIWVLFVFADELLLVAGLFMVFANLDIFIHLIRTNVKTRKAIGGALAHVGFGLMLVGILFSSGFDRVVSVNPNSEELANFPKEEQGDNVLLVKDNPRQVPGFQITYLGEKMAKAPVSDLRVMEEFGGMMLLSFRDASGDWFKYEFPVDIFTKPGGATADIKLIEDFLNDRVEFLRPPRINERHLFGVRFDPLVKDGDIWKADTSRGYILYPEAEVTNKGGEGGQGEMIAHPARKITLTRDIYVHVSSLPQEEPRGKEPEFKYYTFELGIGESVKTAHGSVYYKSVTPDDTTKTDYAVIARAHIEINTINGKTFQAEPLYRIRKNNEIDLKDDYIAEVSSFYYFTGINPQTGKIELRIQEEVNDHDDFIVLKALEKPWINVLWLGTFVMLSGFFLSIRRRRREAV